MTPNGKERIVTWSQMAPWEVLLPSGARKRMLMGKRVSELWLPARQGLRRARAQRNSLGGELQDTPPALALSSVQTQGDRPPVVSPGSTLYWWE